VRPIPFTRTPTRGAVQQGRCGLGRITDATQEEPHPYVTDSWSPPLSLTDGWDPPSSPSSRLLQALCFDRRREGKGVGSCDWRGRDSPCPRNHLARQATEPIPHASHTHATPPTLSARVTSPWPHGSTHRVPTTLTPPTICGIRFWHHQFESRLFYSP
jgi:hypothetical protein